jgi:hypothetical protein
VANIYVNRGLEPALEHALQGAAPSASPHGATYRLEMKTPGIAGRFHERYRFA